MLECLVLFATSIVFYCIVGHTFACITSLLLLQNGTMKDNLMRIYCNISGC